MISTIKKNWRSFSYRHIPLSKVICYILLAFVAGSVFTYIRNYAQNSSVGWNIETFHTMKDLPFMHYKDQKWLSSTSLGLFMFRAGGGGISIERDCVVEFEEAVSKAALLTHLDELEDRMYSNIRLLTPFDGKKATIKCSIETLCSHAQFQKQYHILLLNLDNLTNDLFSRMKFMAKATNVECRVLNYVEDWPDQQPPPSSINPDTYREQNLGLLFVAP